MDDGGMVGQGTATIFSTPNSPILAKRGPLSTLRPTSPRSSPQDQPADQQAKATGDPSSGLPLIPHTAAAVVIRAEIAAVGASEQNKYGTMCLCQCI